MSGKLIASKDALLLKYVNCEEEKYSEKKLKFNMIVFSSNSHKTVLRICSNSCVK